MKMNQLHGSSVYGGLSLSQKLIDFQGFFWTVDETFKDEMIS